MKMSLHQQNCYRLLYVRCKNSTLSFLKTCNSNFTPQVQKRYFLPAPSKSAQNSKVAQ